MMKLFTKILAGCCALAMVFSLAACKDTPADEPDVYKRQALLDQNFAPAIFNPCFHRRVIFTGPEKGAFGPCLLYTSRCV